jgi:hypothetical protein
MSHDGDNLETKNCVVSSRISTNALLRQTDVFTIPERAIRILYMLKLILKRAPIRDQKQECSPRNYYKENSLKVVLYVLCFRNVYASSKRRITDRAVFIWIYTVYIKNSMALVQNISIFREKKLQNLEQNDINYTKT